MIAQCNKQETSSTATQMLDSAVATSPTRAGGRDANAIFDGTDAIMLSGNSWGRYPWSRW